MTSVRQIEANRRNSEKSTGPRTEAGKQRSSRNALRHGLTAETVILPLEDPEDYQAFEEAVLQGFDPETAVERELVLRVAGLLWRLRRAVSIETGLFQLAGNTPSTGASSSSDASQTVHHLYARGENDEASRFAQSLNARDAVALRALTLVAWDGALERMSRYELALCASFDRRFSCMTL